MNTDSIRKYCLAFPQATEILQWGDDLCFKIRGKMFAVLGLDNPRLCFKCTPESFAELIERENIEPAPYVGRYKWVILERLDALRDEELKEFLRQSYEMVEANAPRAKSVQSARKKPAVKSVRRKVRPKKRCLAAESLHLSRMGLEGWLLSHVPGAHRTYLTLPAPLG